MDRRAFLKGSTATAAILVGAGFLEACDPAVSTSEGAAKLASTTGLAALDATAQAELLRSGEASAKELAEAGIQRIEALNPALNAVVTKDFDRALERADSFDNGGAGLAAFAGVPYLIKDLTDFKGVVTSHGSRFHPPGPAGTHPTMVSAIEAAGLNVLGKSNTPEFGLLATTESVALGPCRNPWNTDHSSGGSSGGSAAAVASGMVPFAFASDGGGSIRIPASCCGVFGLKPSRGRMLDEQEDVAVTDISVRHTVSRTVRDSARLFSLTEASAAAAGLAPVGFVDGPSNRRLKIAFSTENLHGLAPEADVEAALTNVAALCESLGHQVTAVPHPVAGSGFLDQFILLWASGTLNITAMVEEMTGEPAGSSDLLEPWTLGLRNYFHMQPTGSLEVAIDGLQSASQKMAEFMADYDVWLTPVLNATPPLIGEQAPTVEFDTLLARTLDYVTYTPLQNAAGLPAMSVPLSLGANGLPIGSHFTARYGDERTLFELAYELEAARPWAEFWPPSNASAV